MKNSTELRVETGMPTGTARGLRLAGAILESTRPAARVGAGTGSEGTDAALRFNGAPAVFLGCRDGMAAFRLLATGDVLETHMRRCRVDIRVTMPRSDCGGAPD